MVRPQKSLALSRPRSVLARHLALLNLQIGGENRSPWASKHVREMDAYPDAEREFPVRSNQFPVAPKIFPVRSSRPASLRIRKSQSGWLDSEQNAPVARSEGNPVQTGCSP